MRKKRQQQVFMPSTKKGKQLFEVLVTSNKTKMSPKKQKLVLHLIYNTFIMISFTTFLSQNECSNLGCLINSGKN